MLWSKHRPGGPITRALLVLAVAASLLLAAEGDASVAPSLEFVSPQPGSNQVLPETNIILRPGGIVNPAPGGGSPVLSITGSLSGPHQGQLQLSDDGRTLTFRPDAPFAYGEQVTCRIGTGLATDTRGLVPPGIFTFTIAGPERESLRDFQVPTDGDDSPPPSGAGAQHDVPQTGPALTESLPPDFPHISAAVYGKTAPGRLFLSNSRFNLVGFLIPSYLMILENDGTPFFYRQLQGQGIDFKMQPDGRLTYFDVVAKGFYALNANYDVVDSFRCGNGYVTDGHDLVLLPNGHAILMSYDTQIVDMTSVAIGGRFNARVIGLVLQELDQAKHVVFQWRSWDHFQITDIVSHSLAAPVIDYVHGNSIDADPQGNLILSSRHMNEVTKISRTTGEILWRMGGKNNQFTLLNDPISFSHQHCVRRLPDGHILMFDNGNFRLPLFSRAVEYAIDETQKTATLVWQYRHTPDVFGPATGSVQRFSNGNTLIGWGLTNPTLTEVASDGSVVSELTFDPDIASYRAFRFEWPPAGSGAGNRNQQAQNSSSPGSRPGSLKTGAIFQGLGQTHVLTTQEPTAPLQLVSAPGVIPVELTAGEAATRLRTLAVYDVQGRLITRWRTIVGAGRHATWDGLESGGRRVASGIYLVRMEDGEPGSALKIIVAR